MSTAPVICFGQQPCGFFPKRFLVAKIQTARRLQEEIGGEIVFFYHDSDHDPRETQTILRHRKTNEPAMLNFAFENKMQRKFSPLFLKRIPADWQAKTVLQLPNYVEHPLIEIFKKVSAAERRRFLPGNVSPHGLARRHSRRALERSGFRRAACDMSEFFVDVPHEGEIVRARFAERCVELARRRRFVRHIARDAFHQGTNQSHARHPAALDAIRGALHALHCRAGEKAYLRTEDAPEIIL